MWPRKRPDIGWRDLSSAAVQVLTGYRAPPMAQEIVEGWFPEEQSMVCLSVRSGFDLALQALRLPRGSEIIFSAVTIPDMLCIAEHHGLTPVPVEVYPHNLEVSISNLKRAITATTRVIVVAHLFGSRATIGPIVALAKQHALLVFEDCAQTFIGKSFAGHDDSDVSLFSFGPIKTATALGGAVVRSKHYGLLHRMRGIQETYRSQHRLAYGSRVAKCLFVKSFSSPRIYGILVRICLALGIDYDRWVSQLGRSFAGDSLLPNIRKRPCSPLQRLLARRVQQFEDRESRRLRRRVRAGRFLARGTDCDSPNGLGVANPSHTYWVFAVRTPRATMLVDALRRAGFDATVRSSLCDATYRRATTSNRQGDSWVAQAVFLPCDVSMSAKVLRQLRSVLLTNLDYVDRLPSR